jgi:hypothetical protein
MKTIKFSRMYNKFPRDYQYSMLLDVIPIKLEDMSREFLDYDTAYEQEGETKYYDLPGKGEYMILMLRAGSGKGQLWTTIRKLTLTKYDYYLDQIGSVLKCSYTPESKHVDTNEPSGGASA